MITLSALYQHLLWFTLPLLAASTMLLVFLIRRLLRLTREAVILSLPLLPEQDVELTKAEPVTLCLQGPLFTSRFADLRYVLSGTNGAPVPGRRVWLRSGRSGWSDVSLGMYHYAIPAPGRYHLKISGLGAPGARDSEHRLVFARRRGLSLILHILAIVLSSALTIASLVLSLLRLTE